MSLERLPVKKNRPVILILLLLGIIFCMVLLYKCSHSAPRNNGLHPVATKSGPDTIDVAIEISPLAYHVSGDTIAGLDYDILNYIARSLHKKAKYHVFASLNEALSGAEAGLYDVIVSSLAATEELKDKHSLSEPVYLDRQVLVQLKNSPRFISTPQELGGDTVWIAAGSPFEGRIRHLSAEIGEPITILSPDGRSAEHLIMLVATGQIPRAVANLGLAQRMQQKFYPNLDISTPISFTQFQSWILTHCTENLADSINSRLIQFQSTPAYIELTSKYGMLPVN